ncbi:MAG: cytochrome o ubiquinol oxidase subunit IV [Enterobacterales bacterium]
MLSNFKNKLSTYILYKPYFFGFLLSIILTIIPFVSIKLNFASNRILLLVILASSITQIIVHLIYFIHIFDFSQKKWFYISFIFTILVTLILITGSIWIMNSLYDNLM